MGSARPLLLGAQKPRRSFPQGLSAQHLPSSCPSASPVGSWLRREAGAEPVEQGGLPGREVLCVLVTVAVTHGESSLERAPEGQDRHLGVCDACLRGMRPHSGVCGWEGECVWDASVLSTNFVAGQTVSKNKVCFIKKCKQKQDNMLFWYINLC